MAFCDLFKEFMPIQVDDDIYLRQHEPEKMPDHSGKYIMMKIILHISEAIEDLALGMKRGKLGQKQAV